MANQITDAKSVITDAGHTHIGTERVNEPWGGYVYEHRSGVAAHSPEDLYRARKTLAKSVGAGDFKVTGGSFRSETYSEGGRSRKRLWFAAMHTRTGIPHAFGVELDTRRPAPKPATPLKKATPPARKATPASKPMSRAEADQVLSRIPFGQKILRTTEEGRVAEAAKRINTHDLIDKAINLERLGHQIGLTDGDVVQANQRRLSPARRLTLFKAVTAAQEVEKQRQQEALPPELR